jgi:hypothetical protein
MEPLESTVVATGGTDHYSPRSVAAAAGDVPPRPHRADAHHARLPARARHGRRGGRDARESAWVHPRLPSAWQAGGEVLVRPGYRLHMVRFSVLGIILRFLGFYREIAGVWAPKGHRGAQPCPRSGLRLAARKARRPSVEWHGRRPRSRRCSDQRSRKGPDSRNSRAWRPTRKGLLWPLGSASVDARLAGERHVVAEPGRRRKGDPS